MTAVRAVGSPFLEAAERAWEAMQVRAEPAFVSALRRDAFDRFLTVGLPTGKQEEWRFTPLQGLASTALDAVTRAGTPSAERLSAHGLGEKTWRVVMVDGQFSAALSRLDGLPPGATVMSLADASTGAEVTVGNHLARVATAGDTPFTALNTALWQDGLFLHLAPGVRLDRPVQLLHLTTGASTGGLLAPRLLVVADAGASAVIVESFEDEGGQRYLTDAVAELVLGEEARVEHVRVQREAVDAWHAGFTGVMQARTSHFRSFVLSMGARWFRHNLHVRHLGTGVETLLYGLSLARAEQLADHHTAIFHDRPECNSWEVYKGVYADSARGVFNGKVIVQPEAQRTDAKQTNRNLLLSDTARVDTKPQLEIFADDVKCTHGATVGRLDERQRFYLQTRGIAGRTAQALLIWAFAAEVLAEVTDPEIRQVLEASVRQRLDEMIP